MDWKVYQAEPETEPKSGMQKMQKKMMNRYEYCLVVLTILKNMKVNGKDYPIYYGK